MKLDSCPASLEQTPASIATNICPILRIHQTSSLASSPQLFHSKPKTLLLNKSYPDSSSSSYLPPSITIHHSRLTVFLSDSLDLYPLHIDVVLYRRLWISWFPRLRFCGRCRNLEFTIIQIHVEMLARQTAPCDTSQWATHPPWTVLTSTTE